MSHAFELAWGLLDITQLDLSFDSLEENMKAATNTFKPFDPSQEDKAFLYQQIQTLETLMPQPSQIAVVVEKAAKKGPSLFSVAYFVLWADEGQAQQIEAKAENKELSEAASIARESLAKQLEMLKGYGNAGLEREVKIQQMTGGHLIH
jgi:hypothetical protein